MKSMTGYGRGTALVKGVRVVVECFSVNRKQAEVSVSAPREMSAFEPRVREEVLKCLARGKVQVAIAVEEAAGVKKFVIDSDQAAIFLRQARALQKKLGLPGEVDLKTVLAAPGVLRAGDEEKRDLWPLVKKALGGAMEALVKMRVKEGGHIQTELKRVAGRMADRVRRIRRLAPRVPKRQRENLLRRLKAAALPVDLLEARLITEIAVFAERCDITEELDRLESHHVQFCETLDLLEPVGRTLEFIAQEMGREWNTTGAKANDTEISRLVVEAKADLDRVREQLANIE
jgi:uncharacterized protein (TIGR00255 family)